MKKSKKSNVSFEEAVKQLKASKIWSDANQVWHDPVEQCFKEVMSSSYSPATPHIKRFIKTTGKALASKNTDSRKIIRNLCEAIYGIGMLAGAEYSQARMGD